MRWRRNGDPLAVKRRVGRTESERFWEYVDKTGACWLWTGASSHGYGNFFIAKGEGKYKQVQAHRWSYAELVGPIPEGLVIDHLCRVKKCVNPRHLQPVSQQVNVLRGDVARALRENRCINGHEYTPENTRINTAGARQCRTCDRARPDRRTKPARS